MSGIAYIFKVMSPLIEAVDYGQQFLVVGVTPNFRSFEFSAVKYYWSPIKLGNVQIFIGLQEDIGKGEIQCISDYY